MHTLQNIYKIAVRECGIIIKNPIYWFCMVLFPVIVIYFFTSLMQSGVPTDMPVGVVDLDNTATTRAMIRKLDAFQSTKVIASYNNVNEARLFLLTPYSIGTELKFKRSKEWMAMAENKTWVALTGKFLPQTIIFLAIFYGFEFYIYGVMDFPHPGGVWSMLLLGLLAVTSAEGFGIFTFGLIPSLRMSMSVCSLWSVVSFSACGATFPAFAMSPIIEGIAQLFPLRHYYMVYQMNIFNGFPLMDAWFNLSALVLFSILPIFTMWNIKRSMLLYDYIP